MSWKHRVVVALGFVFLGCGLIVWAQDKDKKDAGEQERQVEAAEVPEAALATLKKLAGSATITEFAEEIEHGNKFYEGSWKGSDGNIDGLVTEAGDVVEIEESIAADKAPASVRAAAAKAVGADTAMTYERKTMYLYEIHFTKGGKQGEMIFTPDGRHYVEAVAKSNKNK